MMRLKTCGLIVIAFLFLLISGCAKSNHESHGTWINVADINDTVVKNQKDKALLTTDEEPSDAEKDKVEQKTRDLSSTVGKPVNPYLQQMKGPAPLDAKKTQEGEGIMLNFDNADIYEFIQVVAEILDLDYVIDPQVKGTVNIRSGKAVPRDQLFAVFKKILNANGLDIRQMGDFDYIFVSKKPVSERINGPEQLNDLRDTTHMIMQVVPVMFLSSSEVAKLLKPYLSEQGTSFDLVDQNVLIINDYETNIVDALSVLSRLDISPLATLKVRMVRVEKAPLFEVRDELVEVLKSLKVIKKDFDGVSVVPLERVNSLLLISNNDFLLDTAEKWMKELDRNPQQGKDSIYIYNVRNSVATELASLVNAMIEGKSSAPAAKASASSTSRSSTSSTTAKSASPPPTASSAQTSTSSAGSPMKFSSQPTLLADDSRNIILIRAHGSDYERIVKLLERLDNLPRQVLIEVIVAQVDLRDSWSGGVEWALKNNTFTSAGLPYTQNFITGFSGLIDPAKSTSALNGFAYSVVRQSGDVVGLLNALADNTDLSILSSPQVLVLNNESAKVNVGKQVPITTTMTDRTGTTGVTDRTVQYKDTGVILEVTPRINFNGVIILDISQEVSDANLDSQGNNVISVSTLKTKLAVKDAQSILMGGLIKKNVNNVDSGVPVFKDIPGLGWMFKYKKEEVSRTELLVVITAFVIETEDVLDQYIAKFKEQTQSLRGKLTGKEKTNETVPNK